MTVKELINVLKGIEKKHGNLEVFILDPFGEGVTGLGIRNAEEINVVNRCSDSRPGIKVDISE